MNTSETNREMGSNMAEFVIGGGLDGKDLSRTDMLIFLLLYDIVTSYS